MLLPRFLLLVCRIDHALRDYVCDKHTCRRDERYDLLACHIGHTEYCENGGHKTYHCRPKFSACKLFYPVDLHIYNSFLISLYVLCKNTHICSLVQGERRE